MGTGKERAFNDSWFERSMAERVSDPPPLSGIPLEELRPEGRRDWAMGLGALCGAGGGVAMMFVSREIARRVGMDVDVVRTIGHGARNFTDEYTGGFAVAVVVGALFGIVFGALFRHMLRVGPRILAGVLLAPIVWTLFHAFVFKSLAPTSVGALPFGPMAAGAAIYGLCIAIIPPPRKRA